MRTWLVIAGLFLTLSGCDLWIFNDEGGDLSLTTDSDTYTVGSSITIVAENRSSDVIYHSTCMPTELQELADGQAVQKVGFPTCACVCATDLKPGQKWTYEVGVAWLWMNQGPSQPKVDTDYRFQLAFFKDPALTEPIDADDLTTNVFRFRTGEN